MSAEISPSLGEANSPVPNHSQMTLWLEATRRWVHGLGRGEAQGQVAAGSGSAARGEWCIGGRGRLVRGPRMLPPPADGAPCSPAARLWGSNWLGITGYPPWFSSCTKSIISLMYSVVIFVLLRCEHSIYSISLKVLCRRTRKHQTILQKLIKYISYRIRMCLNSIIQLNVPF